jgi:proton glutamate symport protein
LPYVVPVGEIYLDILKMCILPILLSAISVSISRLLQAKDNNHIGRMLTVFAIGIFISAILGTVIGLMCQPGSGYDKKTLSA